MSCRSTRASSAAVSLAFATTGLNETQVQSIFHELKHEGKKAEAPSLEEYHEGLDMMRMHVNSDEHLKPFMKERLLERIADAYSESPLDSSSWFAVQNIQSQAKMADRQINTILAKAANHIGVSGDKVKKVFDMWLSDKGAESFEDVHTPDMNYRYDLDPLVPHDLNTGRALRKLGYEEYLTQPYPVFVYGTLRTGQGNHVLMRDAVETHHEGYVEGVGIYGPTRGFPYATEHQDASAITVGEVIWLSNDYNGLRARQDLDSLESFSSDFPSSSHYERVLKKINIKDAFGKPKQVDAWMYLARGYSKSTLKESDRIHHGDWVKAKQEFKPSARQSFYDQLWADS